VYYEAIVLYTGRHDFALCAKIKSSDLLLQPKIIHKIITHNILQNKWHYDEVIFMDICLIDCMIRSHQINLLYIMIRNMIMTLN
jgi:hypothetical protein